MPRASFIGIVALMAIDRILLTPRWGGTVESDWYPWVARREPRVERLALPAPDAPTIAGCVDAFGPALGDGARTLVVGHSVSVQAWLHTFAARGVIPEAFLAVAGWWTVDAPWPTIEPWLASPPAVDPALSGRVLLGTGDPFTADTEANAARWRAVGADVTVVPDGAHFNRAQEPAVWDALVAMAA